MELLSIAGLRVTLEHQSAIQQLEPELRRNQRLNRL